MTDEQLDVARAHVDEFVAKSGLSKTNLKFVKGHIEVSGKSALLLA